MTRSKTILVALLTIIAGSPIAANSIFSLLRQAAPDVHSPTEVTLTLPLDSIYAKSANEQSAVLSFTDETGLAQRWPLHVDVRGKYRRRICTFPPLKLNFSKKELKAEGLEKFDKLKLVTPCTTDEAGQALILREYLAYQLLQQLSPASFRTQLLEVTYEDVNGNYPDLTVLAFVLEDTDEMASRLGGVELEDAIGLPPNRFDRRAETTQAFFSYFIGNTDWNIAASHNLKMVEMPNGLIVPVPYDFDFAAIVSADYAKPNNSVGQFDVRQRVYMGYLNTDSLLESVIDDFRDMRKELLRTVRQFKPLSLTARQEITAYLISFYYDLDYIRRNTSDEVSLFTLLRGDQPGLVPPGVDPAYYGVGRK